MDLDLIISANAAAWIAGLSALVSTLAALVGVREARESRRTSARETAIQEAWDAVFRLEGQVKELMLANRAASGTGANLQKEFHAAHDHLTGLLDEAGRPHHGVPARLEWSTSVRGGVNDG